MRDGKKTFRQYHRDGDEWVLGRGDAPDLLYHLPEVRAAVARDETVYICEGEPDVESLRKRGLTATTNPGGAGKWKDEHSKYLRGAPLVIVYDRDEAGRRHALDVWRSLRRVKPAPLVTFRRPRVGKDVTDHLEAGYSAKDLLAKRPKPPKPKSPPKDSPKAIEGDRPPPAVYQLVVQRLHEHAEQEGLPAPRRHIGQEGWEACCPAHDDRNPSLGVEPGTDRAAVVCCQAGCEPEDVIRALGIDWTEFSAARPAPQEEDDVLREVKVALAEAEREDARPDHLDDALDFDQLMAQPPPEELVEGYLPKEGVALIYGVEGAGKTVLVVDLDVAVRSGRRLFGKRVRPGATLMYAGEGAAGLADRYAAYMKLHGVDRSALRPFRAYPESINLESAAEVARVVRSARRLELEAGEPIRLVTVDPFIEFTPAGDVESTDRASRALRVIARMLRCCVLVMHHSNAEGKDRGTRHLSYRVHTRLKLEEWRGGERWLVAEKQRHAERRALELCLQESGSSVAFAAMREMTVTDYQRIKTEREEAAQSSKRAARDEKQVAKARELLRDHCPTDPSSARSKRKIVDSAMKQGVGRPTLEVEFEVLAEGEFRSKPGPRDLVWWREQ